MGGQHKDLYPEYLPNFQFTKSFMLQVLKKAICAKPIYSESN